MHINSPGADARIDARRTSLLETITHDLSRFEHFDLTRLNQTLALIESLNSAQAVVILEGLRDLISVAVCFSDDARYHRACADDYRGQMHETYHNLSNRIAHLEQSRAGAPRSARDAIKSMSFADLKKIPLPTTATTF